MSQSTVEFIGYLAILYLAAKLSWRFSSLVYRRFLASPLNVKKLGGDWAVVTGATDGIGKAYAFVLAKRQLNVVLVSRTPFKLQNVAADIEAKFPGIKTKILDVDFAKEPSSSYIPRLEDALKDIKVGVLVNNVGMSYEHPDYFLDIDSTYVDTMVDVNITSANALTRIVLPGMLERNGGGAIINISSLSAAMTTPLLTVYSATKSYMDRFSTGLAYEYGPRGITVQCILPGHVVTKLSKIKRPSLTVPTPDAFVKSALGRLGIDHRTGGYWAHDILLWVMESCPQFLVTNQVQKQMVQVRARALKKKQN